MLHIFRNGELVELESTEQSFLQDVAARLPDLSPQLQRAADYLLEHPDEVAMHSLRGVARKIGVTPPTLSRLARALNCQGYEDLRNRCRNEIRNRNISLADKIAALQSDGREPGETRQAFAVRHAKAAVTNIETTLAELDIETLRRASERIAAARNVFVCGALSGAILADYLVYIASTSFANWHRLGADHMTEATGVAMVDRDSCLISIGFSPPASRTVELTRICRTRQAHVLVLTDRPTNPLVPYADETIYAATRSPQFFPTHMSFILLIEILAGMLAKRGGKDAIDRATTIAATKLALGEHFIR